MPPVRGERETRKQNPALWKRATTGSAADLLTPYHARFRPVVPRLSPFLPRLHCPAPSITFEPSISSNRLFCSFDGDDERDPLFACPFRLFASFRFLFTITWPCRHGDCSPRAPCIIHLSYHIWPGSLTRQFGILQLSNDSASVNIHSSLRYYACYNVHPDPTPCPWPNNYLSRNASMQHCEPTTPRPRRRGMTRRLSRGLNTVCFVQCQSGSFRGHVHRLVVRRGMSSSGKSPSRHRRHDHSLGSVVADTCLIAQQVLQDGRSTRDRTTGGLCGLSHCSVSAYI
jgi:hypothetical protein